MMKTAIKIFILWVVTGPVLPVSSQHLDRNSQLTTTEELALPIITDDENIDESSALYWQELAESPIDINQASVDVLKSLTFLSNFQIESLLRYRTLHGDLISLYELQAIPNFDIAIIRIILPYIKVGKSIEHYRHLSLIKRLSKAHNHYLLIRSRGTIQPKEAFRKVSKSRYIGKPYSCLVKYRLSEANDFSLGITMENDAGESWRWEPRQSAYGVDFISYHLQLKNKGIFKNIIFGDFKIQSGQGLLFAGGFSMGKGAAAIESVKRYDLGIVPYSSSSESGFMRGLAISNEIKNLSITTFFSRIKRDATLQTDSVDGEFVSSLNSQGFHRNTSEISRYKSQLETMGGVHFIYKKPNLRAGMVASFQQLAIPVNNQGALYKKYQWNGKFHFLQALNFDFTWENFNIFAEFGIDNFKNYGIISGLIVSLSPALSTSFLFRRYTAGFQPLQGKSMAESSKNQNETGFYWGLEYQISRYLTINAYFDRFKFLWPKFGIDRPGQGYEYLFNFRYKFIRHGLLSGNFKKESKPVNNASFDNHTQQLSEKVRSIGQLGLQFEISEKLAYKINLQASKILTGKDQSAGMSISYDFILTLARFQVSSRILLFDTDNYDNRHYRYEKDVLYAFSIPSFSGEGIRTYLLFKTKFRSQISLWIKWSQTAYYDRNTIGTGNDQINNSRKTDWSVQVKYQF